MKYELFGGVLFLGMAVLCLGHMGQLVPMLPRAWFLMVVGVSAFLSYAVLGVALIAYVIRRKREERTSQNRWRKNSQKSSALGRLFFNLKNVTKG